MSKYTVDDIDEVLGESRGGDPLAWTTKFSITDEEADMIADPDWVIRDLIIQGHVVVIVAEPNGGKTTILFHLCEEMVERGYQVFYVNADISGGDAKPMVNAARAAGFTLMLPDMAGQSMDAVIANLNLMAESGGRFDKAVFIFDTLKKMTDVISKSKAKELYRLLRNLSAKGMTIVLLAHTNKYKDTDGNPVYEGTADLRSDVDELIYLIPDYRPDKSLIVSTKPDKVRGAFKPISFEITPDREVRQLERYVDTLSAAQHAKQMEKDATVVEAITEAIKGGKLNQKQIIEHCKADGIGWRTAEAVLRRYKRHNRDGYPVLWVKEKAFEKNAWVYHLEDKSTPPNSW